MNHLLQNAKVALQEPGMLTAYLQWCAMKAVTAPKITVQGHSIENFINFSEYWGVRNNNVNESEFKFIQSILSPKSTVIDVGGNIGIFTVLLASLCQRVYSFEPAPETFERLKGNVFRNKLNHVSLHQLALSNISGEIMFSVSPNSPATNHIAVANDSTAINVPVTTLDTFVQDNQIETIDFLKIDVEGFEASVLEGAEALLSQNRVKYLFIEICPSNFEKANSSVEKVISSLSNAEYNGHFIEQDGTLSETLSLSTIKEVSLENVVFCRN